MSEQRRCTVEGRPGTFIQYGSEPFYDESNNPMGMRTTAIVELDSGHVLETRPSMVIFPTKPKAG